MRFSSGMSSESPRGPARCRALRLSSGSSSESASAKHEEEDEEEEEEVSPSFRFGIALALGFAARPVLGAALLRFRSMARRITFSPAIGAREGELSLGSTATSTAGLRWYAHVYARHMQHYVKARIRGTSNLPHARVARSRLRPEICAKPARRCEMIDGVAAAGHQLGCLFLCVLTSLRTVPKVWYGTFKHRFQHGSPWLRIYAMRGPQGQNRW